MARFVSRGVPVACGALALAWAVVGVACRQTVLLDDLGPDAGAQASGGTGSGGTSIGFGSGGRTGSGGSGNLDASTDGRCFGTQNPIAYTADTPQLLVAIDRSTAMNAAFGNSNGTQLSASLNAVLSEVDGYGGEHNNRQIIQFAFVDFPDVPNDCDAATGCCPSDVSTNYSQFEQQAGACNPNGPSACLASASRPMTAALTKAHDYFSSGSESQGQHSGERYVLLITDGDPDGTCSTDDPCSDAIKEVNALTNDLGVTTEVVAIGSAATCLPNLGYVQSHVSPTPYYAVDATNLPAVVNEVAQTVAQNSCRLTLASPPLGQLEVYNGPNNPVSQDTGAPGNGWSYAGDGSTRVILNGQLCQSFLSQSPNSPFSIQIYDACAPRVNQGP